MTLNKVSNRLAAQAERALFAPTFWRCVDHLFSSGYEFPVLLKAITGLHRKSSRPSTVTAWLLVALFVMQPIVSFLAAPALVSTSQGEYIFVCTLKGITQVQLDGNAEHIDSSDPCPALQLIQQLASGNLNSQDQTPAVAPQLVSSNLFQIPLPLQQNYQHYSSRAPPSFS
ncbi:MAG: hypothetical protein OQK12_06190 [Motiliproteus sp.]|nr:hypothetical protein [Motiliproteus sp.]MCW9051682.1 hypothetical protein [Motiliproteus sp.]